PDLNVVEWIDCTSGCISGAGGYDSNGHGTHVAGTVAALDNNIGVVGVAPGADLYGIRVLNSNGSGSMADVIDGVDWAVANTDKVSVINMSLSGGGFSQSLYNATAAAKAAGIVTVVAAGNSNANVSTASPAAFDNVLTVSALADYNGQGLPQGPALCSYGADDTLASFSNYGAGVDIMAPGVCIDSTHLGSSYSILSGTSMAAPHAAGAAALLASMGKPTNAAQVDAIVGTLQSQGTFDYIADSKDGIQEPLLNVGNSSVFDPVFKNGVGGGGPSASFTTDVSSGVTPLPVNFTDTSTGNIDSWAWDFGDGNTSTDPSPTHTYTTAGSHTVELTVTGPDGTGTSTTTIEVSGPPVPASAGFTESATSGDYPLEVTFTDTSTGSIDSWAWDFGDGNTSTDPSPTHTYTTAGTRTVSLTVNGPGGPESVLTKTNLINVTAPPITYCSAEGSNQNYEHISRVVVGDLDNSSGASGYSDFTGQTAHLNPGDSASVALTPGFAGSTYSENWAIWIDYNGDGDFTDGGEQVFTGSSNSTLNGNFTVPGSASGSTVMRVAMNWSASPDSCGDFTYGEVEDYTVELTAVAPTAGFNASTTTPLVGDEVDFTDTSTGNIDSWAWDFGDGNTSTNQNPSHTYATADTYTVELTVTGPGGNNNTTTNIVVTEAAIEYCSTSGGNQNYEYISGVQVGGFTNNSGAASYTEYTASAISLAPGANTNVALTPTFPGSSYNEFWGVWIDYNRDGDFNDSGEQVFSGSSNSVLNGNFTVDSGASGTTRMRVAMQWNAAPPNCGNFTWGEVEDYTVEFS
ncbi:MAG: PKD domain-containing protein, partial [Microthrixaceae bacterium]